MGEIMSRAALLSATCLSGLALAASASAALADDLNVGGDVSVTVDEDRTSDTVRVGIVSSGRHLNVHGATLTT
jgi:hypothetical protein